MAEMLPLFPLSTVLLPGTSLPLHIFEPRYRQLTMDLITEAVPGRSFGVIATRPGRTADTDGVEPLHPVGCTALLDETRQLPDGRFDLVTRGEHRFRLLDVDTTTAPYLVGQVEWEPDDDPGDEQRMLLPMLAKSAREAHRDYCAAAWHREDWTEPGEDVEYGVLPHLLAANCLLSLDDRQALLEQRCPADRLRMTRKLLVREAAFLQALQAVPVPLSQLATGTSRN